MISMQHDRLKFHKSFIIVNAFKRLFTNFNEKGTFYTENVEFPKCFSNADDNEVLLLLYFGYLLFCLVVKRQASIVVELQTTDADFPVDLI